MEWVKDAVAKRKKERESEEYFAPDSAEARALITARGGPRRERENDAMIMGEDFFVNRCPPKDVARRRFELEKGDVDHGLLAFSVLAPISVNEQSEKDTNSLLIVVVLHEMRESGWFELGRTEPQSCTWPSTVPTTVRFLRAIPITSTSHLRAALYEVGEPSESIGPLQKMTLLGITYVNAETILESPGLSVQNMLTMSTPLAIEEGRDSKTKSGKASPRASNAPPSKQASRTTACPALQLTLHECSWPLVRTSSSTIGRSSFCLPLRSRGYMLMSEQLKEVPLTALIPSQLLGIYILRVGGTISFLRRKIGDNTTPDSRLQNTLEHQLKLMEDYKAAASELLHLGEACFKSFKRRSDCSSVRFVPNNCLAAVMRVEDADWRASYPTITFAAPAAGAAAPFPTDVFRTSEEGTVHLDLEDDVDDEHSTIVVPDSAGLLTFDRVLKRCVARAEVLASRGSALPSDIARKMTALSVATARRRDIVFAHVLTVAVASFRQMATHLGHAPVFWRQMRRVGFLLHFESTLSAYAHERAQLEDLWDAVRMLSNVSVRVVKTPPGAGGSPLRILYRQHKYCVELYVPSGEGSIPTNAYWVTVKLVPVLLTQGIDEMQSFANKFNEDEAQSSINAASIERLRLYVEDVKTHNLDVRLDVARVQELFQTLRRAYAVEKERETKTVNVDLLLLGAQICRELRGGRISTCAEGCGRTSMSITLEQMVLLRAKHQLCDASFYDALRAIRIAGVQRSGMVKNTGSARYRFTKLQRGFLPDLYKPPSGSC
eukprot:g3428.t1